MPMLKPKPSVLMTEIDGEAVLLDTDSSYYFSLNETGTLIWRALSEGKNETEITDALVAEWDVTRDEAAESIAEFLGLLQEEGLVSA